MKNQKKNKTKFTWRHLTFNDPYEVIKEIFNYANIDYYRNFIRDVLLYSTDKKQYKEKHAANIMYLTDGVACLLQACFVISKEKKHSLLEVRNEDLLNTSFYSLRQADADVWSDFPRSLTQPEVLDPYKTFGKIFQHNGPDQWYELMKDLLVDACSSDGDFMDKNTLKIYLQLSKLFEAAHLIHVREIDHIENWRRHKNVSDRL